MLKTFRPVQLQHVPILASQGASVPQKWVLSFGVLESGMDLVPVLKGGGWRDKKDTKQCFWV